MTQRFAICSSHGGGGDGGGGAVEAFFSFAHLIR